MSTRPDYVDGFIAASPDELAMNERRIYGLLLKRWRWHTIDGILDGIKHDSPTGQTIPISSARAAVYMLERRGLLEADRFPHKHRYRAVDPVRWRRDEARG